MVTQTESHTPSPVSLPMTQGVSPTQKKGELIYKCDICDVKFSEEATLHKHRLHDHRINAEMNNMMQKSKVTQQQVQHHQQQQQQQQQGQVSRGATTSASDKFSQLCVYCNQTFKTKSELEKHMKTHVTPSNQKCNICDEIFPSASILAEHKLTHCKVVKGNVCVMCKVPIKTEEQFYNHAQQHGFQGSSMQCVVCRQTLASMLELQMHARHHFTSTDHFFSCCVCLKTFDSKENLITKLNSSGRSYYVCKPCYHGELTPVGASTSAAASMTSSQSPANHRCPVCDVKFETMSQLEVHAAQHKVQQPKTYQCIKCQQSFSTEYEIQIHVATHVLQEGNIHQCHLCDNTTFESPAKLQCHLIEHAFDASDFGCCICGMGFTEASGIQMHVLEHGVGARTHACNQCPQNFFFSTELINHLCMHASRQQDGQGKLKCPECAEIIPDPQTLLKHYRLHDKTPLLPCSGCAEVFDSILALQQHYFTTHSLESPQRALVDTSRTKPLISPSGGQRVSDHSMSPDNGNHGCTQCTQEFPTERALESHMAVHATGMCTRNIYAKSKHIKCTYRTETLSQALNQHFINWEI